MFRSDVNVLRKSKANYIFIRTTHMLGFVMHAVDRPDERLS